MPSLAHSGYILAMLRVRANLRPLFPTAMGVFDSEKWPRICSNSKYNIGGHLGLVHRIKTKMAPAVFNHKIMHMVQISAQSEQL